MLRITQIKVKIEEENLLRQKIIKKLKLNKDTQFTYHIYRKNIDARDKQQIYLVYTIDVEIENEQKYIKKKDKDITIAPLPYVDELVCGEEMMKFPPIVVGFGPAGIFSALQLAEKGFKPIVLERGECIEERDISVQKFIDEAILNEESNIQFGEGGAGTYSDGKLTARTKDIRMQKIYDVLIRFGAPKEIAYEGFPHIGSDLLKGVIKNIRNEIIRLQGTILFSHKVDSLIIENNEIQGVMIGEKIIKSNHIILAVGNSSRDMFIQLDKQGVLLKPKDMAIGFRIEHKQEFINKALYHEYYKHPSLQAASYRLTSKAIDRGVYSFCMCPGGTIVAATSIKGHLCVNGMSNYKRDEENANSAILVQVNANDYGPDLFDGMNYIQQLEKKAFELGGSNYFAPVQNVSDFLNNKVSKELGDIVPSYPIGTKLSDLNVLLSEHLCANLKEGLTDFNRKMYGFCEQAILTGIETRSSSPITIVRNKETLVSLSTKGLYPCGEGAGYAGGIVSSAIDGLKVAEKIIQKYHYKGDK